MVLYKNVLEHYFCANKHISKNTKIAKKFLYIIYKARGNKIMINFELLCKINRHDHSMTESEKKQFRMSKEWLDHRQRVYDKQNGLDYITKKPLQDNWNCHHIVMINSEYTNLNNPFVALNKETHVKIHETFSLYFDDKEGWNEFKNKHGFSEGMKRFYTVIEKMFEMNDDIEPVLYQNNYDYSLINPGDKFMNAKLCEELSIPTRRGMIMWNEYYLQGTGVPQDTDKWILYMKNKNGEEKLEKCLELRHACLYSSYKNFRDNPKIRLETKRTCKKELERTTQILRTLYK